MKRSEHVGGAAAERNVVAALLVYPGLFEQLSPKKDWFRSKRNQRILDAMNTCWLREKNFDLLLISEELRRGSALRVVGLRRLAAFMDSVPDIGRALAWARMRKNF